MAMLAGYDNWKLRSDRDDGPQDEPPVPDDWDDDVPPGACRACGGRGCYDDPHPLPDDPYFAIVRACEVCEGFRFVPDETPAPQQHDRHVDDFYDSMF